MTWIALRMLTGDRAKYAGIVAGVALAALLMAQQGAIFCGVMLRSTSQIRDVLDAEVWVMDPGIEYIDEVRPMKDDALYQVRSVPGVAWAVPFSKGIGRLKLGDGNYQQTIVLGVDDATLTGAPREVLLGSLADLRQQGAVLMDEEGFHYLWPGEPLQLGRVLEMNDRRMVLVGICRASPTFQTFPVVYTRYSEAVAFVPQERKRLSFVLVHPAPGVSPEEACVRIESATGLRALTGRQFAWKTVRFYLRRTRVAINFGITISLGFVVGCAVAGQTFFAFTLENLGQFGALKAMGVTNRRILAMVAVQSLVAAVTGYGIGVGLAALFGAVSRFFSRLAFFMPWQVLAATGVAVLLIAVLSSLASVYKVLVLEPAIVFRG